MSMEGRGSGVSTPPGVAVELHEHQVPDLDEAAAAVERELLVLAAGLGGLGTQVVVDLRAGAAGAGLAHLPEVVLLVEAEDAVSWARRRPSARAARRRRPRGRR